MGMFGEGWRQIARKERRHLSVKMTQEETAGNPTHTTCCVARLLRIQACPALARSESLRLSSLCPMKYKVP